MIKQGNGILMGTVVAALTTCIVACNLKSDMNETTSSATTSSQEIGVGVISAAAVPAIATGPTRVTINFYGTVTHLLRGSKMRAVMLRGDHLAGLQVSTKDITESDLKNVFGSASVSCIGPSDGPLRCTALLDLTALRFASKGTPIAQPSTIMAEDSFNDFVPHLETVTGSKKGSGGHGKFKDVVADALTDDVPKANSIITSWIALPGGELSATPYNWTGKFDNDHETTAERYFAREIILTSTIDTPTLEVRKGANWVTLPIQSSGSLELKIFNAPVSGSAIEHFDLHYDLAKIPLNRNKAERPEITLVRKEHGPALAPNIVKSFGDAVRQHHKGGEGWRNDIGTVALRAAEVPGCSNSQWP